MNNTFKVKLVVTAGALFLAATHQWAPIKLDMVTIFLLVIAILPWLQPIVKSVELLGVKLELQELQEKVDVATGAAESAKRKAFLAESALESAGDPKDTSLMALADQYDYIRRTQGAGDARTSAMTAVVHKIIELAHQRPDFDIVGALAAKRGGLRLVAYILLYVTPSIDNLEALVKSVTTIEDKPFGQYWGIQAIARSIDTAILSRRLPRYVTTQLRDFITRIPRGTDRDYELRQILSKLASEV